MCIFSLIFIYLLFPRILTGIKTIEVCESAAATSQHKKALMFL